MRHHNTVKKFGRVRKVRRALMRSLAVSLIRDGKIKTTETKAKELRKFVEPLVTKGRSGTLAARRVIASRLAEETAVKKLFDEIAPKYKGRTGGYTRVLKLSPRKGDAAKQAVIEFV